MKIITESCEICKNLLNYDKQNKIFGITVCKSKICNDRMRVEVVKRFGINHFIKWLEFERENNNEDESKAIARRVVEINKKELNRRCIKRCKEKEMVYRIKVPKEEVSFLVGLNYAYKINKKGIVFRIYNLNEICESLEEIKRRLNAIDNFVLEPFLTALDERKSIKKWNNKAH